ncbi:thiamine ABC transporter substrate binding subunit [Natronospirillum operosum]|uniref:Thiamine-binding periplasmic protein n=1 Tax=Natronospirillum operosum TaxID=2759953 RepID=A0A4Z0WB74_9GAMM|nr:thiamine ABC transporter substrate binding subunit [Natronospirillum operosum]TGG95919.1 thiamine ABC transporter substrate binding subunit [Natronospirillum operosum]
MRTLTLATGLALAGTLGANELTVYTYSSFTSDWGPGPEIKSAFEAQCDCTLNFVSSDDGVSLLNRVRLEGVNTQADVVLGVDDALIEEARALELFQPHGIDWSDLPLAADLAWSDDLYVPFDYGYFAFVYDTENIDSPATSMEELLSSDVSILYQDPRTSTVGQGLMHWMQALYGDNGVTEAWQALAERTVTVTQGWSESYGMFQEGEADYVLSYTTSPAYHMVAEDTDRYQAATFEEGHVAQIEVAAISAFTDQAELAAEFLDFLLSREAQQILPVTNWMLPVRTDVELPAAFDRLATPERIGHSPTEIHEHRQAWIRTWRNAVSQ